VNRTSTLSFRQSRHVPPYSVNTRQQYVFPTMLHTVLSFSIPKHDMTKQGLQITSSSIQLSSGTTHSNGNKTMGLTLCLSAFAFHSLISCLLHLFSTLSFNFTARAQNTTRRFRQVNAIPNSKLYALHSSNHIGAPNTLTVSLTRTLTRPHLRVLGRTHSGQAKSYTGQRSNHRA